jgi:hypothetical protein
MVDDRSGRRGVARNNAPEKTPHRIEILSEIHRANIDLPSAHWPLFFSECIADIVGSRIAPANSGVVMERAKKRNY